MLRSAHGIYTMLINPIWLALPIAVLMDRYLGEPTRWHPLVGFGRAAQGLERRLNTSLTPPHRSIATGALAWLIMVGAVVTAIHVGKALLPMPSWLMDALALWLALGGKSLQQHVSAVVRPLQQQDLTTARWALSRIVSRDTAALDEQGIARATIETTLENGADAIFASLFWFMVGMPLGLAAELVLMHRAVNTLDAMWGYKNSRFLTFGRIAARSDDLINWLPARLTALSYALVGHTRSALNCWSRQASAWDSPNAGVVMASGAGALQVQLGGAAQYDGHTEIRPDLGCVSPANPDQIIAAQRLIQHSLQLWLGLIGLTFLLTHWSIMTGGRSS
jgi:adenosylcobinamide-phosphate synthase